MVVLVHWRPRKPRAATFHHNVRVDHVEGITCDGRIVSLIQAQDAIRFPLRWVAEFQLFEDAP
ncbi:MAG TPA: hypothetical protein VN903_09715 [Polyangia bacterium]|nr:hypothetical protein [Polyangia bacterium]